MLVASLMMAVASVSSPAGALNSDPTQVSTSILP
jgi:hypothetical protein